MAKWWIFGIGETFVFNMFQTSYPKQLPSLLSRERLTWKEDMKEYGSQP